MMFIILFSTISCKITMLYSKKEKTMKWRNMNTQPKCLMLYFQNLWNRTFWNTWLQVWRSWWACPWQPCPVGTSHAAGWRAHLSLLFSEILWRVWRCKKKQQRKYGQAGHQWCLPLGFAGRPLWGLYFIWLKFTWWWTACPSLLTTWRKLPPS